MKYIKIKLGFEQKKKGVPVITNISSFTNLLLLRGLEGKEIKGVEKMKEKKDLKRKCPDDLVEDFK